jgi:hypothetical protein
MATVDSTLAKLAAPDLDEKERQQINSLLPPEGDESVGHVAFQILERIVRDKDRKRLPQKWFRNYEMYRNHHWRSGASAPIPLASISLVNAHVERTVNLLTDNNPTFDVIGENDEVADSLHKMSRYWWNETEQQDIYGDSVKMAEVNGCTVEKVIFNPSLNNGLGDVETIVVDPHNFGFWPLNEKRAEKWEVAAHYYTMPLNQVRRKWPEFKEVIKPDTKWKEQLGERRREVVGGTTRPLPQGTGGDFAQDHAIIHGNPAIMKIMGRGDEVLILELWIKDYTLIQVEQQGATIELDLSTGIVGTTEPAIIEKVPKYPGFVRVVTSCNGGDVILSDRQNPSINPTLPEEKVSMTFLYNRFPFTLTPSTKDPVTPWGYAAIEQLEQLNIEIDKSMSQLNYMKDRMARSPLINPKDTMIPNSDFSNAARIVNPKNSVVAKAIRYMESPPVQNDIQIILNTYRELFDKIAGTFDLTDPSVMKGRLAFKTVAAILENMHTLIRGKIRTYGRMIRDRGRMYISHVQNWYTEERFFFLQEGGVPTQGSLVGPESITPLSFQVVSGSTMPTSRLQQREEALQLFEAGAIGIRDLLESLEWPDRAEITNRMEAGVMGPLIEKMEALGVDPQAIEIVQEIANMDESTYNAYVQQVKELQGEQAQGAAGAAPALPAPGGGA